MRNILKIIILLLLFIMILPNLNAEETTNLISKKSESRALIYSLGGTIIPIATGMIWSSSRAGYDVGSGALVGTGYLIGPGVGHIYAKNTNKFLMGSGIRLVGAILMAIGFADVAHEGSKTKDRGGIAVLGGVIIGAFGVIYDFVTIDDSVREYNNKLSSAHYFISPTIYTQNKNQTIGLQLKLVLK